MPRLCNVCALEEHRLSIDARLRAGESHAAIAQEFHLSVDSVDRHARNHTKPQDKAKAKSVTQRLERIIDRADELYETAIKAGDARGAIQALAKLSDAVQAVARLGATDKVGFEALTLEEQAERVCRTPELLCAVLDAMVSDTGLTFADHVVMCKAEISTVTHDPSERRADTSAGDCDPPKETDLC
jgi:hypothetical protein